MMTTVGLS